MFLYTQLWAYLLLAGALGAGIALLLRHACGAQLPAPPVAVRAEAADAALAARVAQADKEVDALRRQIAASRAELAQVLNSRDVESEALRAELSAARARSLVPQPH